MTTIKLALIHQANLSAFTGDHAAARHWMLALWAESLGRTGVRS